MTKPIHQLEKKTVFLIGVILIPLSFLFCYVFMKEHEMNLSGLLSSDAYRTMTIVWLLFLLLWLDLMLYRISFFQKKRITAKLIIMSVMILMTFLIPYQEGNSLLSSLHIFIAYASVVYMNMLFYQLAFHETAVRNVYIAVTMIAVFHTFTYGMITGFAEMLYGALCSIMLSIVHNKNCT